MQKVVKELERLRTRTRVMLIVQRGSVVVAWILGVGLALVLLDYSLRMPSTLRLVLVLAGVVAFVAFAGQALWFAFGYHPTLTQLALRVERSLPALRGRLATAVELSDTDLERVNPLAARSVQEAQRRLEGESVVRIIRPGPTVRDVTMGLAITGLVAILLMAYPAAAATGVKRLLAPFGSTQWPARTAVASLMSEVLERPGVHRRGEALRLRARNLTAGDEEGRVDAHFRFHRGGLRESWHQVVLTHQARGVHERLVDASADVIELYFATEDARTAVERIELVPAPEVTRALLAVDPPGYAGGRLEPLELELGPGTDERAITETPSLIGSRAVLTLSLNKPLDVPDDPHARDEWQSQTIDVSPPADVLFSTVPDQPRQWRLEWTVAGSLTVQLRLTDDYGLSNRDSIQYRIEAAADLPPTVTIIEPERDLTVLPSATIAVAGEATDDVAVVRVGLEAARQRGGPDVVTPLPFVASRDVDAANADVEAQLDLAELDLAEGDVVLITAVADDIFELDGQRHDTVSSPVRRLRVISELDFAAQLRRQLSAVRQNAIRIEVIQGELQDDIVESGVQPGVEQTQAELGDRIATQRDVVQELQDEIARNRLEDESLSELLQQSRDLLDYAGRAANRAVEAIARREGEPSAAAGDDRSSASPSPPENGDPDIRSVPPEDREVVDAQQEVRDELSDLIALLDRDEDTWIVQRQLEGLIDSQAMLERETSRLAQETIGQALEDLTAAQRDALEQVARRQRELRDETRRLIEEMRRRAQAMEDFDPQAASGMRSAAETGEQREVDRDMETAAERAGQNQLQSAGAAQASASASLQRMLEDLEATKRARAEELLRQLASLIESIDRLIVVQENELIALATAEEEGEYTGRDRAMIRLNQNTQSVAAEARSSGQQARRIARTLDRAADAQGAAVAALRAAPPDAPRARESEDRSLALLKEAKELAEELQKQTQDDQVQRRREELVEAYRELGEKQTAIRADTMPLIKPEPLSRRELVEARRLGSTQNDVRVGLSDLEAGTSELLESEIFSYVHRLMDGWSQTVSDALWEGSVDVDVTDRQEMIADAIMRQIEALEEQLAPPDEFADEQAQGGGSGSGSGSGAPPLIPPAAELRRLHGLQQQVNGQTETLDRRDDLTTAARRQRLRELGEMQRQIMTLGQSMLDKIQPPAPPAGPEP